MTIGSHGSMPDQSGSASDSIDSSAIPMKTPTTDNTQGPSGDDKKKKKKKKRRFVAGPDKSGKRGGLRQFSLKVCEKVERKGRTTYSEVADELVAEFSFPNHTEEYSDQQRQDDEKNIRRRVYDAFNVLLALDLITKHKKEIQWKGFPGNLEQLKTEHLAYTERISKKALYLQELETHHVGLQNLIRRNEQLYSADHVPRSAVALPFILVETQPQAIVELEISEDMQFVHFDFNSTPFVFHDEYTILETMNLCERQTQLQVSPLAGATSEPEKSSMSEH